MIFVHRFPSISNNIPQNILQNAALPFHRRYVFPTFLVAALPLVLQPLSKVPLSLQSIVSKRECIKVTSLKQEIVIVNSSTSKLCRVLNSSISACRWALSECDLRFILQYYYTTNMTSTHEESPLIRISLFKKYDCRSNDRIREVTSLNSLWKNYFI